MEKRVEEPGEGQKGKSRLKSIPELSLLVVVATVAITTTPGHRPLLPSFCIVVFGRRCKYENRKFVLPSTFNYECLCFN